MYIHITIHCEASLLEAITAHPICPYLTILIGFLVLRTKIVWTKDGDRLTGGRKYRLKANGQVSVRHVEFHDAGRYTCIGKSRRSI